MIDTKLHTSFVPKKTLVEKEAYASRAPLNLLLAVGVIVFFMTVAVGVGVYLYKIYVTKKTQEVKTALETMQKEFDPSVILTLKSFDKKMKEAQKLLDEHTDPIPVMAMIGESTLYSVQLTDFKYSFSKEAGADITVNGVAKSYESIINQTDAYSQSKTLKNVKMSGLKKGESFDIGFVMSATVEPSLLLYKNTLSSPGTKADVGAQQ